VTASCTSIHGLDTFAQNAPCKKTLIGGPFDGPDAEVQGMLQGVVPEQCAMGEYIFNALCHTSAGSGAAVGVSGSGTGDPASVGGTATAALGRASGSGS